jgi:hypothetical protein
MKVVYCNKCFKAFEITRKVMQDHHGQRNICDCFDVDLVLNHTCDPAASLLTPAKPAPMPVPKEEENTQPRSFPSNPLAKPPTAEPQSVRSMIDAMKKGE